MHTCFGSVNGVSGVEIPVLQLALVEEALKVGYDETVGALSLIIYLGVRSGLFVRYGEGGLYSSGSR